MATSQKVEHVVVCAGTARTNYHNFLIIEKLRRMTSISGLEEEKQNGSHTQRRRQDGRIRQDGRYAFY
jgi:hypothetical protein